MPTDVAHTGRVTKYDGNTTTAAHCTSARSEDGALVPGEVWLAMQPLLRTPMLCLQPSSEPEPTEFIFLRTLEIPQRDSLGRGWHLISKLRTHAHKEEFRLEIIRLYPEHLRRLTSSLTMSSPQFGNFYRKERRAGPCEGSSDEGRSERFTPDALLCCP